MINGPIWDELQLDGSSPTILAIGDSWFWYPLNNLANPLHRILNRSREHTILERFAPLDAAGARQNEWHAQLYRGNGGRLLGQEALVAT